MDDKTCKCCGITKPLEMFYRCGVNNRSYRGECKTCRSGKLRAKYASNPGPAKERASRRGKLLTERRRAARAAAPVPRDRICKTCGEVKPLQAFNRGSATCRLCAYAERRAKYAAQPDRRERYAEMRRAYYARNRDTIRERAKSLRAENVEAERKRRRQYYAKNREAIIERYQQYKKRSPRVVAEYQKKYRRTNSARRAMSARQRDAVQLAAQPGWIGADDLREIKRTYERSVELSTSTGVAHHVDHIIPLRGKGVCGLHVPWNLQVLTAEENMRKSNRLIAA